MVGLIIGLFITVGSAARVFIENSGILQAFGFSAAVAGFAVILFPAVAFVLGWLQGIVVAFLLNIVFHESKGLKIAVNEEVIKKA